MQTFAICFLYGVLTVIVKTSQQQSQPPDTIHFENQHQLGRASQPVPQPPPPPIILFHSQAPAVSQPSQPNIITFNQHEQPSLIQSPPNTLTFHSSPPPPPLPLPQSNQSSTIRSGTQNSFSIPRVMLS